MLYTPKKSRYVLPGFTSTKSIGEHHPGDAFFSPGYQFLDEAYIGLCSVAKDQEEFLSQSSCSADYK